jgi:exodeoxyribonuclease VII small subunit
VKTKPQKLPDFEQSLSELEALVQKLEQGDVPLEDALKTFERGVARTRPGQTPLRPAHQKVEVQQSPNREQTVEPIHHQDQENAA